MKYTLLIVNDYQYTRTVKITDGQGDMIMRAEMKANDRITWSSDTYNPFTVKAE